MYAVEVKAIGGWTRHSEHGSYRAAVDQSEMVHGRVMCGTGLSDESAWKYAVAQQGYDGTYADWSGMDDEERQEYETGAQGIGTA